MPNTEEVMGEQATFDAFISDSLEEFEDDRGFTIAGNSAGMLPSIKRLIMPNATFGSYSGPKGCPKLRTLSVNRATNGRTFGYYSSNLDRLTHLLLNDSGAPVYTYGSEEPIKSSYPIANGIGAVYVHSSRVSAFEGNTKWGQYRIEELGDYPISLGSLTDTWDQIVAAAQDGTYASKYQVGDSKELVVDGENIVMTLVAMDTDVLDDDGETTVPMTWLSIPLEFDKMPMDTLSDNTPSNWASCYLRDRLNTWVFQRIGSDALKGAIKTVRKAYSYRASYSGATQTLTCGDKLWVPSAREWLSSESAEAENYESSGPHYGLAGKTTGTEYFWTRTKNGWSTGYVVSYGSNDRMTGAMDARYNTRVMIGFCI